MVREGGGKLGECGVMEINEREYFKLEERDNGIKCCWEIIKLRLKSDF